MSITVVNMRDHKADFRCDRKSAVGNPFVMHKEHERELVCTCYDAYFQECLNPDIAPPGFLEYLDEILQAAKQKDITLGCWCAPKQCHCDTIKAYLDSQI